MRTDRPFVSGCSYRRLCMWRSTRPKQLADKHFQGDRCVSRRGAGRYWRGAGESGGGDEGDRWKDKMHVEEAAKNHCEMIHVAGSRLCAAAAKCVYLLVCVCVCVSRVRRPDVLHTELLRAAKTEMCTRVTHPHAQTRRHSPDPNIYATIIKSN